MIGRILPFRRTAAAPAPPPPARAPADAERRLSPADAERFRRLVLPHLDGAYGLARLLCRDAVAAEDIVQEAFLRALRGFEGFRGSSPKAWLYAIVRNCFFSWAASNRRQPEAPAGEASDPLADIPSDGDTPEAALLRQGEIDQVRSALEAIPEPFREALALRELDELSYREIAEITGAPIGTVMSRLARARQMLGAVLGVQIQQEAAR
jgi:RNA polymerase sigma-70 factor (ECF subfamily)